MERAGILDFRLLRQFALLARVQIADCTEASGLDFRFRICYLLFGICYLEF